jgi:hypothetical protein
MAPRIGSSRHVPDRIIDTWIYKVKDVEFEQREWVEPEDDDPKDDRGLDARNESQSYEMKKQRVKNKIVTMQVELHKKTSQSEEPPHPTEDVHFEVYCKELNLRMEGTDIAALRAAVWDFLDKKFEIKWEYYYLVRVDHQRAWRADGTGMVFSYDGVWKGTTWDGKLLLKQYDGTEMKIKVWPGEFTDKGGNVIACIPANDMNKAALEEFTRRIDVLRKKLADFLRPDQIMQTLTNMAGLALLPPAPSSDLPPEANEPEP